MISVSVPSGSTRSNLPPMFAVSLAILSTTASRGLFENIFSHSAVFKVGGLLQRETKLLALSVYCSRTRRFPISMLKILILHLA